MRTDINIRKPQISDIHYLLDIDLKCFEDNWSLEDWRDYLNTDGEALVCVLNKLPVGYIVWCGNVLIRMAVKPSSSTYLGLGTRLLRAFENTLIRRGVRYISINVPESLCCPDQANDTSIWLLHRGFKAKGIERDAAIFCGNTEDAFIFTKELSEVPIYG